MPPVIAVIPFILVSVAISVGVSLLSSLLFPKSQPQRQQQNNDTQQAPAPNGTVNEKQPIPPLRVIAGRCRVTGDYAFLEEAAGVAYHILVHAAHRIEGYVDHWLHDELVTLDGSHNVTAPAHFQSKVKIETVAGLDVETAWAAAVSTFPSIWTNDHRGDGLAKVMMTVGAVDENSFATVYPQGMPQHSALVDGARVYDPRDVGQDPADPSTWLFSRNLALIRLFHLTHPSGGRLALADMYLADWSAAADVCDETVTNRDSEEEPRYWGGLSWKYRGDQQDPVTIGGKLDEAGELVVYQRGDGLIGVHAGVVGTPDITIGEDDLVAFHYDANQSVTATVLAVRGQFTDPRNDWMQSDAAIYGDPYTGADETQRTATIQNEAVQSHNHMNRLQKLRFIRANAPKVSGTVQYGTAVANLPFRRFVKLNKPNRGLEDAIVELVNGTRLNLAALTIDFSGIVVPAGLYDFDASTEEGIPGGVVGDVAASGVPVPTGFAVASKSETLSTGATFTYVLGSWTHVDDHFTYELQWQPNDASQPPRSVFSNPGDDSVRTPSLEAGIVYKLRLRTWSAGAPSDFTGYQTVDTGNGATTGGSSPSDPTPPGAPSSFTATYNATGFTNVDFTWDNPASANLDHTALYYSPGDFADATVIYTDRSAAAASVAISLNLDYVGPSGTTFFWYLRSFNATGGQSSLASTSFTI